LFGLGDTYSRVRFDLVVNTLTLRAQQTGKVTIFGGEQYRPLLHVRDAAAAVVRALCQPQCGIYNLSSVNCSIAEIAELVSSEFPNLVVERTPQHFEDNRNYRVSSERARREIGFSPTRSVSDGIHEIKRLLDERRLADPSHPRYWNDRYLDSSRKKAGL
jgi:nucleoside-diphosphate-sugar epimerase